MNDDRRQDPDLPPDEEGELPPEDEGVLEFINRGDDPENLDLLDDEDLAELEIEPVPSPDMDEEITPPPAPPEPERTTQQTQQAQPKATATLREPKVRRRFPPAMIAALVVIVAGAVFLLNPFRGKQPLPQEGPKSSLLSTAEEDLSTTPEVTPQSSFEEMDAIHQPVVPETAGATVGKPLAAPPKEEETAAVAAETVSNPVGGENIPDPAVVPPEPADPARPGPDGGLCIQVSRGPNNEGAGRLAAELTERGHRSLVIPIQTARGTDYQTVVGYFETSTAATAYLDRYRSELPDGAWVRSR